jgi:hypothetical protein
VCYLQSVIICFFFLSKNSLQISRLSKFIVLSLSFFILLYLMIPIRIYRAIVLRGSDNTIYFDMILIVEHLVLETFCGGAEAKGRKEERKKKLGRSIPLFVDELF